MEGTADWPCGETYWSGAHSQPETAPVRPHTKAPLISADRPAKNSDPISDKTLPKAKRNRELRGRGNKGNTQNEQCFFSGTLWEGMEWFGNILGCSGVFWGYLGLFWCFLGCSGDVLCWFRVTWGHSGAIWGCFGAFWGVRMMSYAALGWIENGVACLGTIWGTLGMVWGDFWTFWVNLGMFWDILGWWGWRG